MNFRFLFFLLLLLRGHFVFCDNQTKVELIKQKVSLEQALVNISSFDFAKKELLEKNLANINKKLGVPVLEKKKSLLFNLVDSMPIFVWQIMFLLICFLLIFLIAKKDQTKNFQIKFSSLLVVAFFFFWMIFESKKSIYKRAIIMAESTVLYSGPAHDYPELGQVLFGNTVSVIETKNSFAKINYGNLSGWIKLSELEEIS